MNYTRVSNASGMVCIPINLIHGNYVILTKCGDLINNNTIYVRDSNTIVVAENTTNNQIQKIIDSASKNANIEFLGKFYNNISLTITNPVNLIGNGVTTLKGVNDNPIILISGSSADGVKIIGFNFVGGQTAIEFGDGGSNIKIINNSISQCKNGIIANGALYSTIENNSILSIENDGISLKNSYNVDIIGNTINGNNNGIYYDIDNKNINIYNNTIKGSSNYGINLDKSGEYSNIVGNIIINNENGIFINANADKLVIGSNKIDKNKENGIFFGENYRKTTKGEDLTLVANVITNNGHLNVLGRDSIYTSIKVDGNWVGNDDAAFSNVCPKIKMPFYSLKAEQIDSGSFEISIGQNGISNTFLPSTTTSVSFDGGKTWQAVSIINGKATVHVNEGDGQVIIRQNGVKSTFTLEDFVPYVPPVEPTKPPVPNTPTENGTNQEQESNNGGSGSGSQSPVIGPGNGDVDLGQSMATTVSEAIQDPQAENTEQSLSESVTNEQTDSSDSASESSSSQSVAKTINLDDEVVKVAGISMIVLLFVLIIFAYYRRDIESMVINKRRE